MPGSKDTPTKLDELYNPEITDLERNEYQGLERPVIYLDEAKQAITEYVLGIIGEDVDKTKPPFSQHDYGFMSANAINNRLKEQRKRMEL